MNVLEEWKRSSCDCDYLNDVRAIRSREYEIMLLKYNKLPKLSMQGLIFMTIVVGS
jgi:hypothetical protein